MEENEAIKEFRQNVDMPFGSNISREASELAIQALEEIQQYRAIGTVEECRQAKEKQISKKPIRKERSGMGYEYKDYYCSCGNFIGFEPSINRALENGKIPFRNCPNCGQKLDWGGRR